MPAAFPHTARSHQDVQPARSDGMRPATAIKAEDSRWVTPPPDNCLKMITRMEPRQPNRSRKRQPGPARSPNVQGRAAILQNKNNKHPPPCPRKKIQSIDFLKRRFIYELSTHLFGTIWARTPSTSLVQRNALLSPHRTPKRPS
ncbi:hypothetical protein TcCL_Unassigned01167 [Trypanosoma cruzi]|nr:hypothetical protein TcCL_Unassigned01167 [Trypanosoma cruzi]